MSQSVRWPQIRDRGKIEYHKHDLKKAPVVRSQQKSQPKFNSQISVRSRDLKADANPSPKKPSKAESRKVEDEQLPMPIIKVELPMSPRSHEEPGETSLPQKIPLVEPQLPQPQNEEIMKKPEPIPPPPKVEPVQRIPVVEVEEVKDEVPANISQDNPVAQPFLPPFGENAQVD